MNSHVAGRRFRERERLAKYDFESAAPLGGRLCGYIAIGSEEEEEETISTIFIV